MALTDNQKTPENQLQHIAIIMDGNGRWAKKRGLPRTAGHAAGAEAFRRIANYCRTLGVKYLTVYAFSTENWKRSEEEVSGIMKLLGKYLEEALRDMEKNRVRFCFFGDLSRLDPQLRQRCLDAQSRSSEYDVQVNFCLNYGGRLEILQAAKEFAREVAEGKRSILFSTHITSDLERCAHNIVYIKDGTVVQSSSLQEFMLINADKGSTLQDIIVAMERREWDVRAFV